MKRHPVTVGPQTGFGRAHRTAGFAALLLAASPWTGLLAQAAPESPPLELTIDLPWSPAAAVVLALAPVEGGGSFEAADEVVDLMLLGAMTDAAESLGTGVVHTRSPTGTYYMATTGSSSLPEVRRRLGEVMRTPALLERHLESSVSRVLANALFRSGSPRTRFEEAFSAGAFGTEARSEPGPGSAPDSSELAREALDGARRAGDRRHVWVQVRPAGPQPAPMGPDTGPGNVVPGPDPADSIRSPAPGDPSAAEPLDAGPRRLVIDDAVVTTWIGTAYDLPRATVAEARFMALTLETILERVRDDSLFELAVEAQGASRLMVRISATPDAAASWERALDTALEQIRRLTADPAGRAIYRPARGAWSRRHSTPAALGQLAAEALLAGATPHGASHMVMNVAAVPTVARLRQIAARTRPALRVVLGPREG